MASDQEPPRRTSDRRYPARPMVGVGAILFQPGLDRVLLIQRGAEPARGLWSFPGGLLDTGETMRAACSREVLEETGLEVNLVALAKIVERIIRDDQGQVEYHFVIADFWGLVEHGTPRAASDAASIQWVDTDAVHRFDTTHGVPDAIVRALDLARGGSPRSPVFEG